MEVLDSESLLVAIGKYCDGLEYQKANKHRIGFLLSLKNVCSFYETKHFKHELEENGNSGKSVLISSFFGNVKTIIEHSLMFFICSEISNSVEARPIGSLFNQLMDEGYYNENICIQGQQEKITFDSLMNSFDCLQDLFANRYDETVGSHILNLNISIFSAFEYWITKISESYGNEIIEKYNMSRLKKFRKLLKDYENSERNDEKEKLLYKLREIPGNFISFPDKFNFVINKVKEKNYPRNSKKDTELVEFLRIYRNTIHNGGIHKGSNIKFVHKGVTHELFKGEPMFQEDYNDLLDLSASLIDIYDSIISVLKSDVDKELLRTIEK